MKYRAEIDGMRALAVLPVILFHAGFEFFSGGFVGVDVFFVISGYLITTIIISELAEAKFSIINFYERRARRILPALFFVMALCLPFAWLWLAPIGLRDFGKSLVAVSTFSSNILFWSESGYFDSATELKPLLHTWSLAVEEQYYIIFPIFLIASWRLGIKWILLLLSLFFLLSLGLAQWGAFNSPSAAFYLLPTRGWELLVGVFAAFYLKCNSYFKSSSANQLLSLLGLSLVVFSIVVFDENTPFPSIYALVPTIGTGLLILCTVPKTIAHKFLSLKPIVGIGLISYSAYLWHQPLFAFARNRLFGEVSDWLLINLCISSLVMAWFSWRFVEKPFRNKKITTRKTIFTFSFMGILIFIAIGTILYSNQGFGNRASFSQKMQNSFLSPSLDNCFDVPYNHVEDQWGCNLGAKKAGIDFILFGDSHSLSLKKLINDIATENNARVFFTGSSGCIPFLGVHLSRSDQNKNNCNLLNTRVYRLAEQEKVAGIILSARWSYYTLGDYNFRGGVLISNNENGPFTLEHSIQTFSAAFHKTIDEYSKLAIPIHLITQPPHQLYLPETLYFFESKGFVDIELASVTREQFSELNEIANTTFNTRIDDINLYDVTNLFCNETFCPIGNTNNSFYYDYDHINNLGAKRLTGMVELILSDK